MQKKYFIVYENKKGKRTLVSSTDSTKKLVFSSLNGEIVCASYKNRNMQLSFNEHFTKDLGVIRGNMSVKFTITDEIKYSKEPLTDRIIDVILRSVLDKYFGELEIENNTFKASDQDIKNILVLSNYFVSEIIPFIKITGISDIVISKDKNQKGTLIYMPQNEIDEDKNKDSFTEEYYTPATIFLGDDLCFSKMLYPERVYVPQDSLLVFQDTVRNTGVYKNEKARGTIVSKGKHVYSVSPVLFKTGKNEEEENKYMLYPNVIYSVKNLNLYLNMYDEVISLFDKLVEATIKMQYQESSIIDNFVKLEDCKNRRVKDIINKLKEYNVNVEYVTYSTINPCVRSKQRIMKVRDLFDVTKKNS